MRHLENLWAQGKEPKVRFIEQDRTSDQNTMAFALYRQISEQLEDQSINDIRAECKLIVGVGLLRKSDEDFHAFYSMGLQHLTHHQKLAAMEFIPVSSLMSKAVFSEYLDEIIRKYSAAGLSLINPSEAKSYEGGK